MSWDIDDYQRRLTILQESINQSKPVPTTKLVEKIQQQSLQFLVNDPTWNVFAEKLTEAQKSYQEAAEAVTFRLTDIHHPINFEIHSKLSTQLAYARGFVDALDMALELVLQSNKKD